MVYGKITKGLPPLRRLRLNKKHEIIRMKYKKLYEANIWWNDCKFQLHWNKLEWFNPIIQIKIKKPYSVSSILLHK